MTHAQHEGTVWEDFQKAEEDRVARTSHMVRNLRLPFLKAIHDQNSTLLWPLFEATFSDGYDTNVTKLISFEAFAIDLGGNTPPITSNAGRLVIERLDERLGAVSLYLAHNQSDLMPGGEEHTLICSSSDGELDVVGPRRDQTLHTEDYSDNNLAIKAGLAVVKAVTASHSWQEI